MFAAVSNLIMPLGQKSSDGDCLHISATSSSNGTSGLPVVVQRTSGTACLATIRNTNNEVVRTDCGRSRVDRFGCKLAIWFKGR